MFRAVVMPFFLLITMSAVSAAPGKSQNTQIDSLIRRGIDLVVSCEFDSALAIFRTITDRHPDLPGGYFFQAAALQSKMMDAELDLWEDEFYMFIDRAIEIGSVRNENGDGDAWNAFYLGSSMTYKGLYQARSGNVLGAFFSAKRGAQILRTVVELDSTLYDAYLGLGNYMYWSGRFSAIFRWFPWVHDEREEGIRLVGLAIEKGLFSRGMGLNSLGWIAYDRKAYGEALIHFQQGLALYPRSRFFKWAIADTYYRMRCYDQAAEIYGDLLRFIESGWQNDTTNEIICRYKLMKTRFDAGDFPGALVQCDLILSCDLDSQMADGVRKRLRSTERYRKQCLEEMDR